MFSLPGRPLFHHPIRLSEQVRGWHSREQLLPCVLNNYTLWNEFLNIMELNNLISLLNMKSVIRL